MHDLLARNDFHTESCIVATVDSNKGRNEEVRPVGFSGEGDVVLSFIPIVGGDQKKSCEGEEGRGILSAEGLQGILRQS